MSELKKYVIRGLGDFFDGLAVYCEEFPVEGALILIHRIEQPSSLFETFSLPVNGGMYIHDSKLEPYVERDDFLTDNPYGAYLAEGKVEREGVTLLWGLYSRALTVTIKNMNKTLLSQNFFEKDMIEKVRTFINDALSAEDYDIHDAIFDLGSITDG